MCRAVQCARAEQPPFDQRQGQASHTLRCLQAGPTYTEALPAQQVTTVCWSPKQAVQSVSVKTQAHLGWLGTASSPGARFGLILRHIGATALQGRLLPALSLQLTAARLYTRVPHQCHCQPTAGGLVQQYTPVQTPR